jgi:DNA-binding transcriptional LysR family regulator
MEPRLLRSFVAVAEELHFGRAARRLHIAQPPLSVQIQKLEQELGASLFARDRRRVELTDAGAALLPHARRLLADHARVAVEVRRVADGGAGTLAVGYTPTATYDVLPAAVPAFRAAAPDVKLELVELRSAQVPDAIARGRVELGVVCAPVEAGALVSHTLVRESLVVALPARHPLAARARVPASRLKSEPFVGVDRSVEPAWADAVTRALRRAGVEPELVQETDSKLALLGLIASGVGLSVMSESVSRLARVGVVFRPLTGVRVKLPLAVLSTRAPSPRAQRFLAALRR